MNRFYTLPRPVIFAHRGASAHAPENTLAAFRLALEQGADGIELDAKCTLDGEVVVMHDASLQRTTGGIGKVWEHTLAEIKQLDAGRWKGVEFTGERVPTLREVFAAFGGKLIINVELTNYGHINDGLVEKVLALAAEFKLEDSILLSSFSPQNIRRARQINPQIPAALLALRGLPGAFSRSRWMVPTSPLGLHPYWTDVTPKLVQAEKARGRFINVWTVNNPGEIRRLKDLGVDGLFTDDPLMARHVLEGG